MNIKQFASNHNEPDEPDSNSDRPYHDRHCVLNEAVKHRC